jgi:hypothetical protein
MGRSYSEREVSSRRLVCDRSSSIRMFASVPKYLREYTPFRVFSPGFLDAGLRLFGTRDQDKGCGGR